MSKTLPERAQSFAGLASASVAAAVAAAVVSVAARSVIGRLGADLAVLPLTSRSQEHRDGAVFLGAGGWDGGGKDSWVKLDQLLRVAPSKVRREGATLDKARFDRVVDAWRDQAGGN